MKNFRLKIITPKGIYKEVDIEILNIRTTSGQIGILASHLPLASGVEISEMNYVENGQRKHFSVSGGFVYVGEDETTLIVNAIESPEEIDLRRAEEAKDRAEKRLLKKTDVDLKRAEVALKRALTRISVKNGL
jgi:F-type H+-transporting ATPase subunit epsilon